MIEISSNRATRIIISITGLDIANHENEYVEIEYKKWTIFEPHGGLCSKLVKFTHGCPNVIWPPSHSCFLLLSMYKPFIVSCTILDTRVKYSQVTALGGLCEV